MFLTPLEITLVSDITEIVGMKIHIRYVSWDSIPLDLVDSGVKIIDDRLVRNYWNHIRNDIHNVNLTERCWCHVDVNDRNTVKIVNSSMIRDGVNVTKDLTSNFVPDDDCLNLVVENHDTRCLYRNSLRIVHNIHLNGYYSR